MILRVSRPTLQLDACDKWARDNHRLGVDQLTASWLRLNAEKNITINLRRPVRRGVDTPRSLDYARKEWNR